MRDDLIEITAPTSEPIDAASLKDHNRVTEDAEDDLIDLYIKTARLLLEDWLECCFIQTTYDLLLDSWPSGDLTLPRYPLISVDSIKYIDTEGVEQTFSSDNYVVDDERKKGRVMLASGSSWPSVSTDVFNPIKIRFKAGYGSDAEDVPEGIKTALKYFVTYLFENRTPEEIDGIPKVVRILSAPWKL